MTFDFTVLWPVMPDPKIEEIRFSYNFCRNLSKTFCQKAFSRVCWIDYIDDMDIEQVLTEAKGDMIIVSTHPEIVFSPSGLHALLDCTAAGHNICAPVYNLTTIPHQTASLPAQYLDMDTFLEIAELLGNLKNKKHQEVIELDKACVSYRVDFFKKYQPFNPSFRSFGTFIDRKPWNSYSCCRRAVSPWFSRCIQQ